jgi:hypothetical protein
VIAPGLHGAGRRAGHAPAATGDVGNVRRATTPIHAPGSSANGYRDRLMFDLRDLASHRARSEQEPQRGPGYNVRN